MPVMGNDRATMKGKRPNVDEWIAFLAAVTGRDEQTAEADRQLLEAYRDASAWLDDYENGTGDWGDTPGQMRENAARCRGTVEALAAVVKIRAAVYVDHPGYPGEHPPG